MKRLFLTLCSISLIIFLCTLSGCKGTKTESPVKEGSTEVINNEPTAKAPEEIPTKEPTKSAEKPTMPLTPAAEVSKEPTKEPEKEPTKAPGVVELPIISFGDDKQKEPGGKEMAKQEMYYGKLHVEGTKLKDDKGQNVVLRGISTHGIAWFPTYVNEGAFRQVKEEWGCNVVRLAMYTAENNGYCVSNEAQKKNLKNIIDIGVEAAKANDLYCLIDWHILSDGNPNTNVEEAKLFFDEVSKKYAGDPHIIYEICNEPNGNVKWKDVKAYAMEIIPVIRNNDKNAIIIVGTPTWSQDVDLAADDPITGYDNIMYALHFYAGTHKQGLRDKCTKALSKGIAIFVTEYGICDASGNGALDLTEADRWIDYLNGNDISNIAWNLSNKSESSAMIKSSCSKKNGFVTSDLSEGGIWFLDMIKRTNGGLGAEKSGTTEFGKEAENLTKITPIVAINDYAKTGEEHFAAGKGISFCVTNVWDSGSKQSLQLSISVTNEGSEKEIDWERSIQIKGNTKMEISQSWNGEMKIEDGYIKISPIDYNNIINAGSTIGDIGMIIEF